MKKLYELLVYPLSVIDDPFWDFILMSIIGIIAFATAWQFVGEIGIRGKFGSVVHWTIRFIVMAILCFVTTLAIKLYFFVTSIPIYMWIIISIIIACIISIIIYYNKKFILEKN